MEKRDLVVIILLSVIALVVASAAIPVILKAWQPGARQYPAQPRQPGQQQQPAQAPGQEESKQLKTVISFLNIGLIIPLSAIYAGIYRRVRSSFTLGLLAVILALGMYAVTSNPLLTGLPGSRTGDIGLFQIIPDLCATAALIVLTRISLE